MMKNKIKNNMMLILFGVFTVLIYLQHQFVYMYFDDFGYASLSYGYSGWDGGMNFSVIDVLKFLLWQYFNWGGRVIPFFFEIVSLKIGLGFIRIVQTVIICTINFILFQMLKGKDQFNNLMVVVLLFSFYAGMGLETLRNGVYWFTASVLYLWPLLFFFLAVYLYEKVEKLSALSVCVTILFFFAAFSYEQIAVMVVVYVLVKTVYETLRNRKIERYRVIILGGAICGAMLELLAPGNFARSKNESYTEFYNTPFLKRTCTNLCRVLDINIGKDNYLLALSIGIAVAIIAVFLWQKRKISFRLFIQDGILIGILTILYAVSFLGIINNDIIRFFGYGVLAILFIIHAVAYFIAKGKSWMIWLLLAGLCSQGMMIFSPTIPERCAIPFAFVLHFLLTYIFVEGIDGAKRKYFVPVFTIVIVLSWINFFGIMNGYYENSQINEMNHYELLEKSKRIQLGEDCKRILLYKLNDDRYASDMPYQQDYMEYWWKRYYSIPQEVNFIWIEYDEPSIYHEKIETSEYNLLSVWPDVIDSSCSFNEDGSINISATPNVMSDDLVICINGKQCETVVDEYFLSTCVPKSLLASDLIIQVKSTETNQITEAVIMKVELDN